MLNETFPFQSHNNQVRKACIFEISLETEVDVTDFGLPLRLVIVPVSIRGSGAFNELICSSYNFHSGAERSRLQNLFFLLFHTFLLICHQ